MKVNITGTQTLGNFIPLLTCNFTINLQLLEQLNKANREKLGKINFKILNVVLKRYLKRETKPRLT